MENKIFIPMILDLQLFADGGTAGDGGAGAEGETGVKTDGVGATGAASQEGVKSPDAEVKESKEDRNAKYEAFLKEFKDLDDKRVQGIVRSRVEKSNEALEKYNALSPMIETLAKKYGVDPTDVAALNRAIEDDDSYYEQEALERGITVKQLKEYRKMEKENAELKKFKDEQVRKENANKIYASWMDQAEKTRAVYPSFDFKAEMQNPKFSELLRSNIDVRTAYEVIHKDDIIAGAMQYTAKAVEQKVADKIAAGASRPSENGNSSQSATVSKSDASSLSKKERAELNNRILRGERFSFS